MSPLNIDQLMEEASKLADNVQKPTSDRELPPELVDLRSNVCEALDEIIQVGARVRPLVLNGELRGYIRGLYYDERRIIDRWYPDTIKNTGFDKITKIVKLCTTLSSESIENLSYQEILTLIKIIQRMTYADTLLFPFVSAYSTTSNSERMWCNERYGRFANHEIATPAGVLRLVAVPEHYKMWQYYSHLRDQYRKHIDDAINLSAVVKSMSRDASSYVNKLIKLKKQLSTDRPEPWRKVGARLRDDKKSLNDGWGHQNTHSDEIEDHQRELKGMFVDFDKHEQFMEKFWEQHDPYRPILEKVEREELEPDVTSSMGTEEVDQFVRQANLEVSRTRDILQNMANEALNAPSEAEYKQEKKQEKKQRRRVVIT